MPRERSIRLHVIKPGIDTFTMEGRAMINLLADKLAHQYGPGLPLNPARAQSEADVENLV
ncbi:hypothetical protein ACWGLP_04060 [Streptomyces lydicus]